MSNPQKPRFREIDRNQLFFEPVDLESLIDEDHPVRAIWEFVQRLDLSRFEEGIRSFEGEVGRSAWSPQLLISLWIYGFSRGVGKAREISRLCQHDPAFKWLTGDQEVNYHTLSDFRVEHKEELDDLFQQILAVLGMEGVLDLHSVFHDGSKFAANASRSSFHRMETIASNLETAKKLIQQMESEDSQQQNKRTEAAKRNQANRRKEQLEKALEEFKTLPQTTKSKQPMRVSQSDPEARNMMIAGGGFAPAYNVQITTEGKNGFIVAADISQSSSDFEQLLPAVNNVKSNTNCLPEQFVVDSGFASKINIIELAQRGIEIIGPLLPQSSTVEQLEKRGIDPSFGKEAFQYNPETDSYLCPQKKILSFAHTTRAKTSLQHLYRAGLKDCLPCPLKEKCCGNMKLPRRNIVRTEDLPQILAFKQKMQTVQAQETYKLRSRLAEFPFAWFKEKFGFRKFHVRGKTKALCEVIWVSITFNLLNYIRIKQKSLSPAA